MQKRWISMFSVETIGEPVCATDSERSSLSRCLDDSAARWKTRASNTPPIMESDRAPSCLRLVNDNVSMWSDAIFFNINELVKE